MLAIACRYMFPSKCPTLSSVSRQSHWRIVSLFAWINNTPNADAADYKHKNDIDLVIVPGVCFDKEKNRIGFGKGYYDRFLQNANINTIGICFEEQIVENRIPITEYDVKIKKIITDKKIYN